MPRPKRVGQETFLGPQRVNWEQLWTFAGASSVALSPSRPRFPHVFSSCCVCAEQRF